MYNPPSVFSVAKPGKAVKISGVGCELLDENQRLTGPVKILEASST